MNRAAKFSESPAFKYLLTGVLVMVAAMMSWSLVHLISLKFIFLPFFLAVLLATSLGDWKPGVLALMLSAVCAYALFQLPPERIVLENPEYPVRLLVFLAMSGVLIGISEMQRVAQRRAEALVWQLQLEIARHEETEKRLMASEESYRSLFENNHDVVFTLDLEGYFVTANPSALKLSGYALEELRQIRFTALCPPEKRDEAARHYELSLKGRPEPFFEIRIATKAGRQVDLFLTGGPVKIKGETVGVFAIGTDVTERNRAQLHVAAFSQMGQKLSSVTTPVAAGRIIGDVAEELFGWDAFSLNLYSLETRQADYVLNVDTLDGEKTEVLPFISSFGIPTLAQRVMTHGAELVLNPFTAALDADSFDSSAERFASMMHVPIRDKQKTLGVLSVRSFRPCAYSEHDLTTLQALADYCGGALHRIRVEQALHHREEEYRALFDSDGGSKAQVDPYTLRFVRVNPKFSELTGCSEEELLNKTCLDLTHPDDRDASLNFHQQLMKGEISEFRFEKRYLRKDGSFRWADVAVSLVRDAQGLPSCLIASAVDITARIQAEAALRESENRFTSFMQHLAPSAWMKDLQGRYTYVNPSCAKMVGKKPEEIVGMTDIELFPADQAKTYMANDQMVLKSGKALQTVETHCAKDGLHHDLVSKFPILDKHGEPACVAGIAMDITGQKAMEEALALSNQRLSLIAQVTNAVVGDEPLEEQMRNVAETVRDAYGVKACIIRVKEEEDMVLLACAGVDAGLLAHRAPVSGRIAREILHRRAPLFIPDVRAQEFSPAGPPEPPHPAGFVSYAGAPLMVKDRIIGLVGIYTEQRMRDFTAMDLQQLQIIANHIGVAIANAKLYQEISRQKASLEEQIRERVQAEDEVQKLNEELEVRVQERTRQLQVSNAELEAFAYSVSHDLRAPLRSVGGFAEALQDEYAQRFDEQGREFLGRVIQASREMDKLIDDLLHLSRLTRMDMKRQPVNLSLLAEGIVAHLRETEPKRRVKVTVAPGLVAPADARLLRIALENLLSNAWKFTSRRRGARIDFGMEIQAAGPVYFIRDNGAGFDMQFAGKLFGAFQRLHSTSEFPGHGIGLATVQRVIHRHGGQAWAVGEVDHGACFYFTLPN